MSNTTRSSSSGGVGFAGLLFLFLLVTVIIVAKTQ